MLSYASMSRKHKNELRKSRKIKINPNTGAKRHFQPTVIQQAQREHLSQTMRVELSGEIKVSRGRKKKTRRCSTCIVWGKNVCC